MSDNGPQYNSALFAEFIKKWKFTHTTTSPHHPEGNGFAESMVKIVKQILKHAKDSGCEPHLALLSYRATPLDSKITSPAELLYQSQLQSTLPAHLKNTDQMLMILSNWANSSKTNHDLTAGPFYAGQVCMYGILTDASGCQQRSSDTQWIYHTSSGCLLVHNTNIHVTTSRLATLAPTKHLRNLQNRTS